MRRLIGIVIALAVPMAVVAALALATYRPGVPDTGQAMLNRYLDHLRQAGRPAQVVAARAAGYPRSFTASLSGPTFGDSYYFQVSSSDTPVVTLSGYSWAGPVITYSVGLTPVAVSGGGGRPLPYPPQEAWCVQLRPEGTGTGAPEMVLLALHGDLYIDGWVVHELPPDTVTQTLTLVGCEAR